MSKARLERLKATEKRGEIPTSQGNRKAETSSGGVFHSPNKFKKVTEPAASIKGRRREQRESE